MYLGIIIPNFICPTFLFFRLARCCYPGDIATIGGEGGGQLGRHQSFWN